jgi:Tfp pilus assembly protein PilZ
MSENRRYIRAGMPFLIEVFFPNDETSFGAYGWSIGKGGLGFYAQRPLNVDHEILLKVGFLGFSDERPSEVAPATVRWVKPIGDAYAVGVEFKNLNAKEHFVLLGYLEHAEKISHDILKGALP